MPTLSVAFDATLWDAPTTGIGLYARELGRALQQDGIRLALLGAENSGDVARKIQSRTAYALVELPQVLARRREPLFHAVGNFNLPLLRAKGKKFVLTVHDLIPLILPDTVSAAFRWQFRLGLSRAVKVADHVVCVSDRTRLDLLERFPGLENRVTVAHNGVDHVHRFAQGDSDDEIRRLQLPAQYVLYAGALDVRKNVGLFLDAAQRLHSQRVNVSWVLAGQRWFGSGPVEKRVEALRASGLDIRHLGYLSAPAFYRVMRRATAFVFPSRYEGFGLPPLEAMALGVPTIVSNAGSLPEVCGDGALYVPLEQPDVLASELERVIHSETLRKDLSRRGILRSKEFTWQKSARIVSNVYRTLVTSAAAS